MNISLNTQAILESQEMYDIINSVDVCYISFVDADSQPYNLPFNFALDGDELFFHAGKEGRKMEILRRNPSVCIVFSCGHELYSRHEQIGCSYGMKYKSILVFGKAEFVENYEGKENALHKIMKHYTDNQYTIGKPAIENIVIFKVKIEKMTGRKRGY